MLTALFIVVRYCKQSQWATLGDWIKKVQCICRMRHYAIKHHSAEGQKIMLGDRKSQYISQLVAKGKNCL